MVEELLQGENQIINIILIGCMSMKINERMLTNSIKEAIHHFNLEIILADYVKEKFKYYAEFADVEVRNLFKSNKMTASVIKYACSYNDYGIRSTMINRKFPGMECPHCNKLETW